MTEQLPAPPVPADANVRAYPCMPVDAMKLREDPLAWEADAEAFRCALLLWCAAWVRIPAGSLPNNERFLTRLAGLGNSWRKWRRIRDAVLAGWVVHSDENLYHPEITRHVLAALKGRLNAAKFTRPKVSTSIRKRVFERDRGLCRYCTAELTLQTCTIDHVLAIVRGGTSGIDNLALACHPCNASKGRKTVKEWRGA